MLLDLLGLQFHFIKLIQIHLTNGFRAHSSKQSSKLVIYPLTRLSFQTSTFMLSPTHNAWEKRFLLKCQWNSSHTQCDQRIFWSTILSPTQAESRAYRKTQEKARSTLLSSCTWPTEFLHQVRFNSPSHSLQGLRLYLKLFLPQWLQRIKEIKLPKFCS